MSTEYWSQLDSDIPEVRIKKETEIGHEITFPALRLFIPKFWSLENDVFDIPVSSN